MYIKYNDVQIPYKNLDKIILTSDICYFELQVDNTNIKELFLQIKNNLLNSIYIYKNNKYFNIILTECYILYPNVIILKGKVNKNE